MINVKSNGNGYRGFWNPVKVFIRVLLGRWMKEDKITGERYLVDSQDVQRELDDITDEPSDNSQNEN
ncbi:MAG: hypothetical protein SAK29_24175 [Scytonema sp. PMC 1069.18]|nr:hypothetical protein [Scytonema sp. PMC 1069.18]MEC4886087.1 hypothetical protein [Scytonema sp. PMC 1070.18]